uniref:Uncharacterized protein n=1 Tax=Proboscia inermis TaxID=420281 RepID=A0A7S0C069_9STRA|mmetsp:Transcript_19422/g.19721  ORF Transcript_19422/g.19721 Transcript_19422/m.19721 type:complete len:189 (+) Transcript_19422:149-715(+)
MELTLEESLVYPQQTTRGATQIPELKFDKLLEGLTRLVPRFQFRLPPYFINNARALSTLEGIAKSLDPSFNVLQILYPYALNLLITNPSRSPVVDATLQSLLRSRITGRIQRKKLVALLEDSALLSGFRKRRVVRDVMRTPEGKRIVGRIVGEELNHRFTGGRVFRSRSRRRKDELRTQSVYYQYLNL